MRRHSSLHVIPATMFAAGLVLTMKVGGIWQAVSGEGPSELLSVASAEEQGKTPVEPQPSLEPQPSADPQPAVKPEPAGEPAAGLPDTGASAELTAAVNKMAPGRGPDGSALPSYDATEMQLLQKLSARREELDNRERDLDMREGLLKAAEQQLETRSAELAALQQSIQGLIHEYDEQENNKLGSLVKIYEQMKPKDAARIMNELEIGILLDVMHRMKEAKAASILADMDPARAREVTARLADRGTLPEHGTLAEPDQRS